MKTPVRGLALAAILCLFQPSPATAEQAPKPAPRARLGSDLGNSAWISTVILALGLCVIVGMAATARKLAPAGGSRKLRLIGRVGLSPKHSVHVLQVGRRVLLLGAGPQGAPTLLAELDPIDDEPSPTTPEDPA